LKITDWTVYKPDKIFHVLLELHTDAGKSGWGAAFSQTDQVLGALGWLKKFVVGQSPLEIERVTEKLHQVTFWLGRGGAMTHAISAINLALWDAAGKILGQPVHVLLGGKMRNAVPAYGSVLFHPVDALADRISKMKAAGFHAIKLGWDPFGKGSVAEDEKLVAAARKEAGDETALMIDAGGSYPYWPLRFKDALERAKMLADFGVYWFEEPLAPDDLEGYARLTDASPVKIAHGEVLTRRQSFVPYFDRRAMDIVQPDVAKVGGLSEMRRIAWMAEMKGIDLVPHGWNTAVGVAADLQLASTLSSRTFVEFNFGNPLVEELAATPFRLDAEGCLPVSDAPGLGIEIDREKLRRFEQSGYSSSSWTWDEQKEYEAE
jgi:D-galactarolactone cycloisomerase